MADAISRPRAGWSTLEWVVLVLCVVLGVLNLWNPFTYDQSLFAMGGHRLLEGGLLYRDYWDTKQPGIFWFFALGVKLFGYSEEGVHVLEVLWFTSFAAVLMASLKRAFDHRWGPAAAALLVVGFYWAITGDWHQTQPEGLVGFPLFVSMWFAHEAAHAPGGPWRRWLLAGLGGGVVGVFKLLLVALPGVFWIFLLVERLLDPRPDKVRDVTRALGALALGFAIPLGLMLAVLGAQGLLPDAWYTWVVFPAKVTSQIHTLPFKALEESFHWFFERWSAVLALALIGAWTSLRGRQRSLARLLLAWLVVGFGLILVQKFSGWEYHLMLFLVPLGLLAARGVDALWRPLSELRPPQAAGERRLLLLLATLAVFANPLSGVLVKTAELLKDRFVLTRAMRTRHMLRVSQGGGYYRFALESEFLRAPGARPGGIYVIGNPLVAWLGGRETSVPRFGGILFEYMSAEEWAATAQRLETTATPYVFLEAPKLEQLEKARPRTAPILDELAAHYRVMRTSRYGTWFERNDSEAAPAPAAH